MCCCDNLLRLLREDNRCPSVTDQDSLVQGFGDRALCVANTLKTCSKYILVGSASYEVRAASSHDISTRGLLVSPCAGRVVHAWSHLFYTNQCCLGFFHLRSCWAEAAEAARAAVAGQQQAQLQDPLQDPLQVVLRFRKLWHDAQLQQHGHSLQSSSSSTTWMCAVSCQQCCCAYAVLPNCMVHASAHVILRCCVMVPELACCYFD